GVQPRLFIGQISVKTIGEFSNQAFTNSKFRKPHSRLSKSVRSTVLPLATFNPLVEKDCQDSRSLAKSVSTSSLGTITSREPGCSMKTGAPFLAIGLRKPLTRERKYQ